jgi:hypothetical protein
MGGNCTVSCEPGNTGSGYQAVCTADGWQITGSCSRGNAEVLLALTISSRTFTVSALSASDAQCTV